MKTIVLIAHDSKKQDMIEWTKFNEVTLSAFTLYGTYSTAEEVSTYTKLEIARLMHGPEGGDAQVGAMIATDQVDALIFFWDPLTPQPHDVDVKALLRLAVLHNIPTACNRKTADFIISSPLM